MAAATWKEPGSCAIPATGAASNAAVTVIDQALNMRPRFIFFPLVAGSSRSCSRLIAVQQLAKQTLAPRPEKS
jgi:hypothetical protein